MKRAVVTSLLKDSKLDLQTYLQPPFSPQLGEKFVAKQLTEHLTCNNLYEEYQSACRSNHSTETVLIPVSNDILEALDKQLVILVLLDMSAAFDTVIYIDHALLINMLHGHCGIRATALEWFRSYLSYRTSVSIPGATSHPQPLKLSVSQDSVLAPAHAFQPILRTRS